MKLNSVVCVAFAFRVVHRLRAARDIIVATGKNDPEFISAFSSGYVERVEITLAVFVSVVYVIPAIDCALICAPAQTAPFHYSYAEKNHRKTVRKPKTIQTRTKRQLCRTSQKGAPSDTLRRQLAITASGMPEKTQAEIIAVALIAEAISGNVQAICEM